MDLPRTMGAPAENPSDTMLTTAHFKAAFLNAAFFYLHHPFTPAGAKEKY
jgi:hypothetical protein